MSNQITLLIDGNNTLHRAHWIANNMGTPLVNTKGENVGSIFTFLKTIKSYVDQFNATEVYIAWDKKIEQGISNFRNTLTDGAYKSTRDRERNKEVYADVEKIVEITKTIGVKNIFPRQLEADDIISYLCKTISNKKIIVSVDNDFLQLVSDNTSFFNPIKKCIIDVNNFNSTYNMTPKEFLYYKAITGDTSDNIPGIEGYGKVKSTKLAKDFICFEGGKELPEKTINIIKENLNKVQYNLKLMDLSYGIAQYPEECDVYNTQINNLSKTTPNFEEFKRLCEGLEFNSVLNKFDSWKSTFNKSANNSILAGYFKTFE